MASDSEFSSSHCKFHMKDRSGELVGHIDHQELPNPLVGPSLVTLTVPFQMLRKTGIMVVTCRNLPSAAPSLSTLHCWIWMEPKCLLLCSRAHTEFAANGQGHLRAMPWIHHFI